MRALLLAVAFLAGCDGCLPAHSDHVVGCVAACSKTGVQSVTFTKCVCLPSATDGGAK